MPVLPSADILPLDVPASLATEPIGGVPTGSLVPADSDAPVAGYLLVRVMGLDLPNHEDRWFSVEATYDGPCQYMYAVNDNCLARRAGGRFRRIVTVRSDGTYS